MFSCHFNFSISFCNFVVYFVVVGFIKVESILILVVVLVILVI